MGSDAATLAETTAESAAAVEAADELGVADPWDCVFGALHADVAHNKTRATESAGRRFTVRWVA
jgi:hypothetical protein